MSIKKDIRRIPAPAQRAMERNWDAIEDWDRRFYLHALQAKDELEWRAIAYQEGNYLYMADGGRLLDFESQLASANLGHRHPRVVRAIHDALDRYGQVFFGWATDYRAEVAKIVISDLLGHEGWAGRLRLFSSGTDAMDAALALARLYTGRPYVLTQAHSFHGMHIHSGTTLRGYRGPLSSPTEIGLVKDPPDYPPSGFVTIPAPDRQDVQANGQLPSISQVAAIIREVGADRIAAVITETMLTAAGMMGHRDYLAQLRDLTRREGILWIDDEVICGFGRLGRWFGYQLSEDLSPDLMVIGKGMNSCTLPVGGVVASTALADYFEENRWLQGSTWDGHPIVAASVIATVEIMVEEGLIARAQRLGAYLAEGLRRLQGRYGVITRVDGTGLCFAVDVQSSDGRFTPGDRDFDFTGNLRAAPSRVIARRAAEEGVYLSGFLPTAVRFAPPLTITEEEIDTALRAFEAGLHALEHE